jgi:hypothetical protein
MVGITWKILAQNACIVVLAWGIQGSNVGRKIGRDLLPQPII